jgi:ABC-type Mn2+/Zn2+ transport system permease subunit
LAIEQGDLWRLLSVDCIGAAMLLLLSRSLIRIGFHRELAQAQGVSRCRPSRRSFWWGLSLVVAVGIRAVGILPVSALLVLPAATARVISRSFRGMLLTSAATGWLVPRGGVRAVTLAADPAGRCCGAGGGGHCFC